MLKLGLIFYCATIVCHLTSGSVLPVQESSASPGFLSEEMHHLTGICFTTLKLMLDQTLQQQQQHRISPPEAIQQEEKVTPKKVIPPGFEQIGSRFFYIEDSKRVNWFAAEMTCRQMGGQLATIQNEEEMKAINEKIGVFEETDIYWLDLNDLATEGEFVSWTSGKVAPYYNWYEDQTEINDAHCGCFYKGIMFYEACNARRLFICEAQEG